MHLPLARVSARIIDTAHGNTRNTTASLQCVKLQPTESEAASAAAKGRGRTTEIGRTTTLRMKGEVNVRSAQDISKKRTATMRPMPADMAQSWYAVCADASQRSRRCESEVAQMR
eukprot:3292169-Pleurochrysis_carterae.AAC.2